VSIALKILQYESVGCRNLKKGQFLDSDFAISQEVVHEVTKQLVARKSQAQNVVLDDPNSEPNLVGCSVRGVLW
jgi:hypothetical protein